MRRSTEPPRFSPEFREQAILMVYEVREVHDSQWSAIESMAGKKEKWAILEQSKTGKMRKYRAIVTNYSTI